MKSTVEAYDAVHKKISIEIPWSRIAQQLERSLRELAQKVEMPGFRRGKAPLELIRQRFGGEVIEETLSRLMDETLQEVVVSNRIRQVSPPELQRGEFRSGQPFSFQATVEVIPDIELKDLEVNVQGEPVALDEARIDEQLGMLQQSRALLLAVEDRDRVEPGDTLIIDYQAFLDGSPMENGPVTGQTLELGSKNILPGFERHLLGAKVGEQHGFEMEMPEGWGPPEAKGRPVRFEVTVQAIKRKQLPALDDEFARDLEIEGVDTLAGLRQHLRRRLERAEQERARRQANEEIIKQLIEKNPFSLPPSMLLKRQQSLLRELELYFRQQGINLYQQGLSEQQIREDLRPQAEQEVRSAILLEAVAERLGVKPQEKDVDDALQEMIRERNMPPEKAQQLLSNQELRASLYAHLRREKTLDYLRDRSNMKKPQEPEQHSPAGE